MNFVRKILIILVLAFLSIQNANAMPFNTDMLEVQPSTDAVARKKPAEALAIGSVDRLNREPTDASIQQNPLPRSSAIVLSGKRLFESNCSSCHGNFVNGSHQPSAMLTRGMPSIDLSSEAVKYLDPGTNKQPKTDAHFYTYIYNGGVLMPAYGYKFSNREVWEIVSYIRDVQFNTTTANSEKVN